MRNPFGSEGEAYRFVLMTVAAFALIVVASLLGGPWVGVPVWGAVTVLALAVYARRERTQPEPAAVEHIGGDDEKRIVVLAQEPLSAETVGRIRLAAAGRHARILVVCPAPVTPLHHWLSDVDGARRRAESMLAAGLDALERAGIAAEGQIGDEDPLRAVEDALRTFGGDEVVVAGLDEGVVALTRARFALPVESAVQP